MTKNERELRVAVVQAAPVLFNRDATVKKAGQLIQDAAEEGANFILFPEAYIPAYPRGLSFGMVVGSRSLAGRKLWQTYWEQSVEIPSPTTETLGAAVQSAGVYLAMGIIERDTQFSGGTLFCTTLFLGPDGSILGKHRKLKPTGSERLIWGEGDGSTLTVLQTAVGRIGSLICWENYMPLARMAMYSKGVELYLAPTADARETWQATLQHIACEGRCFVLGCNQFVVKDMYPTNLRNNPELADQPNVMCRGGSAIISPMGEVIAGPLYDSEGILFADLDLDEIVRAKLDFDVTGHYARPDVFQLIVNEEGKLPVSRL
jgi:nitrilase